MIKAENIRLVSRIINASPSVQSAEKLKKDYELTKKSSSIVLPKKPVEIYTATCDFGRPLMLANSSV